MPLRPRPSRFFNAPSEPPARDEVTAPDDAGEYSARANAPVVERELVSEKPASLRDFRDALRRRCATALLTFFVVFALGFLYTLFSKPLYTATTRILVAGKPEAAPNNPDNPLGNWFAPASNHDVDTQIELLQSTSLISQVAQRLSVDPKSVAISARQLGKTDLAEVTVTSRSRTDTENFAATLPQVFLENARRNRTRETGTGLQLTQRQLTQKTAQLQKAERALRDFKASAGVVDPITERTQDIAANAAAQAQARQAVAEAASARARLETLAATRQRVSGFVSSAVTTTNPEVETLRDRIASLNEDRKRQIFLFKPNSDPVRKIDVSLSALRARLASTPSVRTIVTRAPNPTVSDLDAKIADARAQYSAAQASYNAAAQSAWRLQNSLSRYNSIEMRQAQLQRAIDQGRSAVDLLSKSVEQISLREKAAQAADAPIQVVSARAPAEQVAPRRIRSLLGVLILSLLAACAAALISDALDDHLKTHDETREVFNAPVLAQLSRTPSPSLAVKKGSDESVLEEYRTLRAGLHRALAQSPERTVLVTSTHAGEGKTTIAANLATMMALENRRVILVDANLRRPELHRVFGLISQRGLTDVLSGHTTLPDVLQPTQTPNLQVLTAGAISPQATDLLNSPAMDELLLKLYASADFILFDSPACLEFSDASILASKIEGVLFVVDAVKTPRSALTRSAELLGQSGAQILGVALNKTQPRAEN